MPGARLEPARPQWPRDFKCLAPYSRYIPVQLNATRTKVIRPFLAHRAALDITRCVTYLSLEHLPGRLTAVVIVMVNPQIHKGLRVYLSYIQADRASLTAPIAPMSSPKLVFKIRGAEPSSDTAARSFCTGITWLNKPTPTPPMTTMTSGS